LMREREEREDLLDAAFSTIVELQEAQRPNWTPMSEPPKENGFYLTSVKYPKHTAYEFLVESGLHDQADELMEMMEKQEALEAKDDGAGAKPE